MSDFAPHALVLAVLLPALGCSSSTETSGTAAGGSTATGPGGSAGIDAGGSSAGNTGGTTTLDAAVSDVVTSDDGGAHCDALVESHPIEGFNHTPNLCDPTNYMTNPPSSGDHYGNWALYQTYTQPFRPGFWVHNLEHGSVVITYNCPEGCAADVARIQAFIDSVPNDCGAFPKRFLLLPDPDLDVRFAASSWGFTIKAACFDRDAFAQFAADHYNHGREDICGGGIDPLTACP
jgi:hypothetical protein